MPCILIWSSLFKRQWHPTPVLLPGKSHGQRSLVGCSPWGREESDMTERLHFHFLLSCIGEENGIPLQYSCLENPRDGGAWWAAVYGVTQSQTWLKWLSSSSIHSCSTVYLSFVKCIKNCNQNCVIITCIKLPSLWVISSMGTRTMCILVYGVLMYCQDSAQETLEALNTCGMKELVKN